MCVWTVSYYLDSVATLCPEHRQKNKINIIWVHFTISVAALLRRSSGTSSCVFIVYDGGLYTYANMHITVGHTVPSLSSIFSNLQAAALATCIQLRVVEEFRNNRSNSFPCDYEIQVYGARCKLALALSISNKDTVCWKLLYNTQYNKYKWKNQMIWLPKW